MTDEPPGPLLDPERRLRLARWALGGLLAGLVLVAAIVGSGRSSGPGDAAAPEPTAAAGAAREDSERDAESRPPDHGREREARRKPHPCLPTPRLHRTRRYAERRSGSVAFAFVDECGRVVGLHPNRVYTSASEIKAMLMVAYLRREDVADRDLGEDERSLLARMIELSDNDAADEVFATVGEAGLVDLAEHAGMRHFVASPAWGGSGITAADQATFLADLEHYVPARHEGYALRLLARVIGGQSWGVPEVRPRGWSIHFKGGWYPVEGSGWRVNQVATLRRGSKDLAVAVLTDGDPTFEYGQETVRGVAQRLLAGY